MGSGILLRRRALRPRRRRGAAVVEMALVLPVLVLLILGTYTTGRLLYFRKSMVVAVGEGLRVATQRQSTSQDVLEHVQSVLALHGIEGATVDLVPLLIEDTLPGDRIDLSVAADFSAVGTTVSLDLTTLPVEVEGSILRE